LTLDTLYPKLHFVDTYDTDTDWHIGGFYNYFDIYDKENKNIALDIRKSPNNENAFVSDTSGDIGLADGSVFIDRSENRLGIGTTTPAYTLDAVGNIKFGVSTNPWYTSSGANGLFFGNSTGSVTYGLGIANSAPTYTLMVGTNTAGKEGYVGIGTSSPQAKLDVRGNIEATHTGPGTENVYRLLTLSANDTDGTGPSEAGFVLNNAKAGEEWLFRTIDDGKAFTATLDGTGGAEFKVSSPTGSVLGTELFLGNGAKNVGGVWINASSRALKENIKPLSTKEALTAFSNLQPVTYNYKTDKSEKVVGFIAEDVPELVSINSRDGLSSMDMVAVLTKVVQEQDKSLAETKSELKKAQEKIAKLETMQKRLAKVESLLTNLALDTSNSKTEKVSLNSK